ncbi:hypothetical protein [Bdellovibrio bacteriovorus]|uniref:hypothetical protein n=1 Tax=Bdellovibrio bacteriovorus TaxID=959 RepID=UPI0035A6F631
MKKAILLFLVFCVSGQVFADYNSRAYDRRWQSTAHEMKTVTEKIMYNWNCKAQNNESVELLVSSEGRLEVFKINGKDVEPKKLVLIYDVFSVYVTERSVFTFDRLDKNNAIYKSGRKDPQALTCTFETFSAPRSDGEKFRTLK